jgi:predicted esterase
MNILLAAAVLMLSTAHADAPAHQADAGLHATVVLLPRNWDRKSELPVAIWLHGYRANPFDLKVASHYQSTADTLGIAIVGVPATREEDSSTYMWANDARLDGERVEEALHEASDRTGATFSRRALFGFSQGAVVALELASRFPNRFSGAIALSPGGNIFLPPIAPMPAQREQTYVISIGAEELQRRVLLARQYRQILGDLGAHVSYREVAGMSEHARPPDWPIRFQEWTAGILGIRN